MSFFSLQRNVTFRMLFYLISTLNLNLERVVSHLFHVSFNSLYSNVIILSQLYCKSFIRIEMCDEQQTVDTIYICVYVAGLTDVTERDTSLDSKMYTTLGYTNGPGFFWHR